MLKLVRMRLKVSSLLRVLWVVPAMLILVILTVSNLCVMQIFFMEVIVSIMSVLMVVLSPVRRISN